MIGKKFLQLSKNDLVKGFILAVLTVLVTNIYNAIQFGELPTDWLFWKRQLTVGLAAGFAYLIKNFFTSSEDKFLKKEPKK